jgi:hypothetical protein
MDMMLEMYIQIATEYDGFNCEVQMQNQSPTEPILNIKNDYHAAEVILELDLNAQSV